MSATYQEFLDSKAQLGEMSGFDPIWMPDWLFDFQAAEVEWACRKGRAAIFNDCGMGKTPMEFVWAENVIRKTNKPVLVLTPLSVAPQFVREGEKFGVDVRQSRDGKVQPNITVTNYEQLDKFNPEDFAGVVCDESGCIKHFDAVRTAAITEFMRTRPYRLLCTATAAPNDYVELGNSAAALGEMGFQDMATRFFKKENKGGKFIVHAWGRQQQYNLKPHAERDFWRWICSWARAARKPSDLGPFDDSRFILPPLTTAEHVVEVQTKRDGFLFDLPASNLPEQREERRRSLRDRCEALAELCANEWGQSVAWSELNDEADLLEKMIPGAVQVSGSDPDEKKEEAFAAFASGQILKLVTKPKIAAWGHNWQGCAHIGLFPSHSFEQYYQLIRRCWRFGQTQPVHVDIVTTEGGRGVLANMKRKEEQANAMFDHLVALMGDHLKIQRTNPFTQKSETPAWIARTC